MTASCSASNSPYFAPHALSRAERRLFTDADVEAAIEEVETGGLVSLLEEFVHLPRGRHRSLHLRSLLTGLHLCTQNTRIGEHEDDDRWFEARAEDRISQRQRTPTNSPNGNGGWPCSPSSCSTPPYGLSIAC
ncbi:hypothetical protein [Streptomyces diastatochromogenes]|uniref:hypothetical protein n=1 Tax=Streptomyces diastatochromogenes TaxID=42236 RepID=UPI0036BDA6B7